MSKRERKYGLDPGDLGVIAIALLFSAAGIWLFVVGGWKAVFTISPQALKAAPPVHLQAGETEMILFPAKPPEKP